jgi:hypothetical protein
MVSAYESRAGITPEFPLVLYNDGGKALANLFTMSNYGGVQWMCHPKLFYDRISSYSESALTNAANTALNDDCVGTYISLAKNTFNSSDVKIFNNELILYIESKEQVEINLISLKGQILYSSKQNLTEGINRVIMVGKDIAKGMYILDIKGNSKLHFRSKVTLK